MKKEMESYYSYKKLIAFGAEMSGKTSLGRRIDSNNTFSEEYEKSKNSKIYHPITSFFLIAIMESKVNASYIIGGKVGKEKKENRLDFNYYEVRIDDAFPNDDLLHNLLFECQCALFLIDPSNSQSFNLVKKLITKLKNQGVSTKYPYLSMILVANKNDLPKTAVTDQMITDFLDIHQDLKLCNISLKSPKNSLGQLIEMIYLTVNDPKNRVATNLVSISSNDQAKNQFSIRCVVLGDSGVGKTSLVTRHFRNNFTEVFLSSIGIDDVTQMVKVRDEVYKLQIWDTAGQERFRSLPQKYYMNADGILLLFSLDSSDSFNNISKWISDIQSNINRNLEKKENEASTTLFLIGNKCDMEERQISRREAEQKAKEYNVSYYEISCRYNLNIDEVLFQMVIQCYSKNTGISDCFNLQELSKLQKETKKECCLQ